MILTLALVIPERQVFECVRGDSMSTSMERIRCAHQHKNDDLWWLRPDGETQVQTTPKQVLRIQLRPREQIVAVPFVESPTIVIAEAVVQVPRAGVQHVDK